MPRKLSPQSVWDAPAVLAAFVENNVKTQHAHRLWAHLLRHSGGHWSQIPEFPKAACALLDKSFALSTSTVRSVQRSSDGETTKLLIELQDGMQVSSSTCLTSSNSCNQSFEGFS